MRAFARFGNIAITVVEAITLGALVILELLSGYKAGVMQHLYFKKIHYLGTLYHHDNIIFHLMALLACTLLLLTTLQHRKIKTIVRYFMPFCTFCAFLIICYLSPSIRELNIYAYLLICLECCVALETLRIFLRK